MKFKSGILKAQLNANITSAFFGFLILSLNYTNPQWTGEIKQGQLLFFIPWLFILLINFLLSLVYFITSGIKMHSTFRKVYLIVSYLPVNLLCVGLYLNDYKKGFGLANFGLVIHSALYILLCIILISIYKKQTK